MFFRRRPPLGHRRNGHRAVPYSSHHWAWCECGFSERGLSEGAAAGALAAHLRVAEPGVPTDCPYMPDDVEEHLTHAVDTFARGGDLGVAIVDVQTALDHYRRRLVQPEPGGG